MSGIKTEKSKKYIPININNFYQPISNKSNKSNVIRHVGLQPLGKIGINRRLPAQSLQQVEQQQEQQPQQHEQRQNEQQQQQENGSKLIKRNELEQEVLAGEPKEAREAPVKVGQEDEKQKYIASDPNSSEIEQRASSDQVKEQVDFPKRPTPKLYPRQQQKSQSQRQSTDSIVVPLAQPVSVSNQSSLAQSPPVVQASISSNRQTPPRLAASQKPILTDKELENLDNITKQTKWASGKITIDYDAKLNFSDEEDEQESQQSVETEAKQDRSEQKGHSKSSADRQEPERSVASIQLNHEKIDTLEKSNHRQRQPQHAERQPGSGIKENRITRRERNMSAAQVAPPIHRREPPPPRHSNNFAHHQQHHHHQHSNHLNGRHHSHHQYQTHMSGGRNSNHNHLPSPPLHHHHHNHSNGGPINNNQGSSSSNISPNQVNHHHHSTGGNNHSNNSNHRGLTAPRFMRENHNRNDSPPFSQSNDQQQSRNHQRQQQHLSQQKQQPKQQQSQPQPQPQQPSQPQLQTQPQTQQQSLQQPQSQQQPLQQQQPQQPQPQIQQQQPEDQQSNKYRPVISRVFYRSDIKRASGSKQGDHK